MVISVVTSIEGIRPVTPNFFVNLRIIEIQIGPHLLPFQIYILSNIIGRLITI